MSKIKEAFGNDDLIWAIITIVILLNILNNIIF